MLRPALLGMCCLLALGDDLVQDLVGDTLLEESYVSLLQTRTRSGSKTADLATELATAMVLSDNNESADVAFDDVNRCWIQFPDGCNGALRETKHPKQWFIGLGRNAEEIGYPFNQVVKDEVDGTWIGKDDVARQLSENQCRMEAWRLQEDSCGGAAPIWQWSKKPKGVNSKCYVRLEQGCKMRRKEVEPDWVERLMSGPGKAGVIRKPVYEEWDPLIDYQPARLASRWFVDPDAASEYMCKGGERKFEDLCPESKYIYEWAPEMPVQDGCWVRMPTGCSANLHPDQQVPNGDWFLDPVVDYDGKLLYGKTHEEACAYRKRHYDSLCDRSNAITTYQIDGYAAPQKKACWVQFPNGCINVKDHSVGAERDRKSVV